MTTPRPASRAPDGAQVACVLAHSTTRSAVPSVAYQHTGREYCGARLLPCTLCRVLKHKIGARRRECYDAPRGDAPSSPVAASKLKPEPEPKRVQSQPRVPVSEKCNMAMVASNMSGHIQKQLTRSLERILEEAHLSGELKLSGRKLKDFPKVGKAGTVKYNLQDTVIADLSKNRFSELPEEVTEFPFLEKLHLYHNAIRIIPETVSMLQSLNYLDLSRNQLTSLPREICRLPLQTLLVAHNRLASLPDELGRMTALAELDAGCNEITSLPPRIGDLARLRSLDLRSNLLVHLPIELTYLRLVKLDISGNRISVLPNEMRKMKGLVDFRLSDNPLTSPPASLCIRGRTHIFKYLERQAAKHERARGGRTRRAPLDARGHVTLDTRSHRRHNVDSGYSTSDGVDKRWSQEIHSAVSFAVVLVAFSLSLHLLHTLSSRLANLFGESVAESPADL